MDSDTRRVLQQRLPEKKESGAEKSDGTEKILSERLVSDSLMSNIQVLSFGCKTKLKSKKQQSKVEYMLFYAKCVSKSTNNLQSLPKMAAIVARKMANTREVMRSNGGTFQDDIRRSNAWEPESHLSPRLLPSDSLCDDVSILTGNKVWMELPA